MSLDKPRSCVESGCPLATNCDCSHKITDHTDEHKCSVAGCPCREFASKGKGFVLGSGDPTTARLAIMLEGPGHEEIAFSLTRQQSEGYWAEKANLDEEIALRQRDYPQIPLPFLRKGARIVGKSGGELFFWVPAMKTKIGRASCRERV